MIGQIWWEMGVMRYPLGFSMVMVLGLTAWSTVRVFTWSTGADLRTKAWIDAILFWGGFAVICGVLGTTIGIIIAAQSIEAAGTIQTTLVWGGIKVALLTTVFGILILAVAALSWFGLQLKWRFRVADEVAAGA